ncbi:MAG: ATP-binding protein [bacterium]
MAFVVTFVTARQNRQQSLLNSEFVNVSQIIDGQYFSKVIEGTKSIAANSNIVKLCLDNGPYDYISAVSVQNFVKNIMGASVVYVMNKQGVVLSSTKLTTKPNTLTRQNYKFRPYFINSMKGEQYIYGALGVTTHERGIYFSFPVRNPKNSSIIGVVVIKMGLELIDEVLSNIKYRTAIVSPEGIVFSSNYKEWLLKSIYHISESTQAELQATRQYAGMPITEIRSLNHFLSDTEIIDNKDYRVASYPFYLYEWKIIMIDEYSNIFSLKGMQRGALVFIVLFVISIIFIIGLIYLNKHSTTSLKHYKTNYMEIFESVNDAIIIYNATNGKVLDMNKLAYEMYGYTKEKFISLDYIATWSADESNKNIALEYMKKTLLEGPQIFQLKIKNKKGDTFWVEINLKKAVITGQKVVLAVVRDIDKRKADELTMQKLLSELKRSNNELQEFAYVASHDLKEPLRMISSYVQLLAKRYNGKLDKDADDYITFATDGAKQMQRLIEDMLLYSRAGNKALETVNVDTNTVIERVKTNLMFKLNENKGTIIYSKLPIINTNITQTEQLFMNLISNSLKFHSKDRSPIIEISAERQADMWLFKIKDNGIGIDIKYFEKIFVIFEKLHTKEEYEGTGIGLSICKKIVELYGGKIWLESELGKGTTMLFTLPAIN